MPGVADVGALLVDLAAEGDELDGVVAPLPAEAWERPTPSDGWSITHQIAHLAWTDEVAVLAAGADDGADGKAAWDAVVLEALGGILFSVTYPAFLGMVPILLPPEERKAAFVLIGQATSLVSIAGPAISGVIVATIGPGVALAIDNFQTDINLLTLGPGQLVHDGTAVYHGPVVGVTWTR